MYVNSPGKVIFLGQYSVLLKGNPALVFGVVDSEGKGVWADVREGERRIISKEFDIFEEPSLDSAHLVSLAYAVGESYLKAKGKWERDVTVELFNSPIFGAKEEKSGLGSSAASTATVIKALFKAQELSVHFHMETIFKLAQFAYGKFANKIGSGFDIAVASFGESIVYKRYNPAEVDFSNLTASIDKPWSWVDMRRAKIPEKYDLLVFNIRGAKTSTIKAVKAFKVFKEKKPERFREIIEKQKAAEEKAIEALERGDDEALRHYTRKAREANREMQEEMRALVPEADYIEPPPLTRVIDKAESLPGVVAGRCPGAGGWDSLAFIIHKDFADWERIADFGREEGLTFTKLDTHIIRV